MLASRPVPSPPSRLAWALGLLAVALAANAVVGPLPMTIAGIVFTAGAAPLYRPLFDSRPRAAEGTDTPDLASSRAQRSLEMEDAR